MSKRLRDNVTSSYFDAAHKLYPKKTPKKIMAFVESYDDISFWKMIFDDFRSDKYEFQVMLPSQDSLAKGKKMVLMNTLNVDGLGNSMIACVDSDYDFLLQDSTVTSRKVNHNRFVFQTYAYAIENHRCFAEGLHEICVQSTLNDRKVIDFERFMADYSRIVYPLFLWNVWFYRNHDNHTFPMCDLNNCAMIRNVSLAHPDACLKHMKRDVDKLLNHFETKFSDLADSVHALGKELLRLGVKPETTYLFMQGHHIMDNVVMKLLNPVCAYLRREREEEIRRLATHEEQFRNEMTAYEHSMVSVDVMLKRSSAYKQLYLYKWLYQDIDTFLRDIDK